jgi:hypothetical protein
MTRISAQPGHSGTGLDNGRSRRKRTGIIRLTDAAESALHLAAAARSAQTVYQLDQDQQILYPKRAAPVGERHERVRPAGIRPARGQRALHALLVEEEHAILAPRLAHRDEHELAPHPRVERMGHTNSSPLTDGIGRS